MPYLVECSGSTGIGNLSKGRRGDRLITLNHFTFIGELFDCDICDFLVGHRVVFEGELAVGEHELTVELLSALYPPRRVHVYD